MSAHGTRSRYTTGCHCEPCTEANRLYYRQWYRARYGGKPQQRGCACAHGTRGRYVHDRCRCAPCTNANRDATRLRRAAARAAA